MYSQCPQCQAIFSVPDSDIGAHHGLVRCGRCSAIFHAVTNEVADLQIPLSDTPLSNEADDAGPPPGDEVAPVQAEPPEQAQPFTPSTRTPGPDEGTGEQDTHRRPDVTLDRNQALEPDATPESAAQTGPDQDTGAPKGGPDREWSAPETDAPGESAADQAPATGFEGEVMEEILIEAPHVLWDAFDEELEDAAGKIDASTPKPVATPAPGERSREGGAGLLSRRPPPAAGGPGEATAPPGEDLPAGAGPGTTTGRRLALKSPYRARDVRMVELPQPMPFKTASLSLLAVFLVLLLVWQVKTFYLDDLSQVPILRPYLYAVCHPLGCALPPRRAFAQIDLVGTSINVNPDVPGALEINARVINRARFPQPYPALRVTLTDSDGRIVGRRTYLPSQYRGEDTGLMPVKAVRKVSINLAQPAENAVGYEVELMAPID